MAPRPRPCLVVILCWCVTALLASPASAQWYVASFTGANRTTPADVSIDQPPLGRTLRFSNVNFEARPLESPQYYGARLGRFTPGSRFGWELEFLHVKMISKTGDTLRISGHEGGLALDLAAPMDAYVQRLNMTHGLNFLFANLVVRLPAGRDILPPVALVLRAGAGPVVPGADSIVDHAHVNGYQYAGLAGHTSAGVDVHLWRWLSAMAEYKLTYARPEIDVDQGTGRTTALTHHVAAGFVAGFRR